MGQTISEYISCLLPEMSVVHAQYTPFIQSLYHTIWLSRHYLFEILAFFLAKFIWIHFLQFLLASSIKRNRKRLHHLHLQKGLFCDHPTLSVIKFSQALYDNGDIIRPFSCLPSAYHSGAFQQGWLSAASQPCAPHCVKPGIKHITRCLGNTHNKHWALSSSSFQTRLLEPI